MITDKDIYPLPVNNHPTGKIAVGHLGHGSVDRHKMSFLLADSHNLVAAFASVVARHKHHLDSFHLVVAVADHHGNFHHLFDFDCHRSLSSIVAHNLVALR